MPLTLLKFEWLVNKKTKGQPPHLILLTRGDFDLLWERTAPVTWHTDHLGRRRIVLSQGLVEPRPDDQGHGAEFLLDAGVLNLTDVDWDADTLTAI